MSERHEPFHGSLVIATNREPCALRESVSGDTHIEQTTGGVVSALVPVVEASHGAWFAWNPGAKADEALLNKGLSYELTLIPVSEEEVSGYYCGFANGALWPLSHYAIDRCRFSGADWQAYVDVNTKFAEQLTEGAGARELVWVHDYHLMLVPELLRRGRSGPVSIGYFHHIPFPAYDVWRVLPWHREILRGLLGADVVGFHTRGYARNFLEACRHLPGAVVDDPTGSVVCDGRKTLVEAFPIGVDFDDFDALARKRDVRDEAHAIRAGLKVDKLLLGIDRLDYTKGIGQRFEAIDALLSRQPEWIGHLTLLQIAVPSRTDVPAYSAFKQEIDEAVGRINGKHGQQGWQPIHCVQRSFSRGDIVAHYLAADVALVTPLRDGMNLVAKEFCAARADGDGVLVLSELAGAADELDGSALTVNPFDVDRFSRVLSRALGMGGQERRARMRGLRRRVRDYDIYAWLSDFLDCTHRHPG